MKQIAGSYNQPFTLRASQIWNQLDVREKAALTMIYQLDNESECKENHRLKEEGCCRPADDWRWIPVTPACQHEWTLLQTRLREEVGMGMEEALRVFRILEMRGLIRCHQDRWSADDRLYVRILFLGQRVVREGLH